MADVTGNLSFGKVISFPTQFHMDQHASPLSSTLDVPLNRLSDGSGESHQSLLIGPE